MEPLCEGAYVRPYVSPDLLDAVYQDVLAGLTLRDPHRDDLRRRGLNDEQIARAQYRSLANADKGELARTLYGKYHDDLFLVPGVEPGDGGPEVRGRHEGLLIPVRRWDGQLVALKLRQYDAEPRYLYFSGGRVSCGAPVHVLLGVRGPVELLRVTEGELKADVATALSGVPTISVPGVAQWRLARSFIHDLRARRVSVSFDWPEVATKAPLNQVVSNFVGMICMDDLEPAIETWPMEYKGIDDALAAGATIQRHEGNIAVRDQLEVIRRHSPAQQGPHFRDFRGGGGPAPGARRHKPRRCNQYRRAND
jgi:hypothetical protein